MLQAAFNACCPLPWVIQRWARGSPLELALGGALHCTFNLISFFFSFIKNKKKAYVQNIYIK